jgi:hypothetical protein
VFQAKYAEANGNNYALVLAWTIGVVAVVIAVLTFFGRESRGTVFAHDEAESPVKRS